MTVTLVALAILVLLFLRVPVAFAIMGPCAVYFMVAGNSPGLALKAVFDSVNSFPLLAVPLFVFVGVIANRVGIAERLFEFCLAALARVRGNLAYVTIATSVGFAWMSGSALADAAGLGKMQVPALVRNGYHPRFATGLVASSALISPVMPPSIPAVIFAATATISTGALFAASVIPALLMALGLVIYVVIWTSRQDGLKSQSFSAARLGRASLKVLGPLGAPVIILGGIVGGIFTPTEAAGVAGLYMLLLGVVMRTLTWKVLWSAAKETVFICCGIMIIIGAAGMLGQVIARERVAISVAEWLTGITESPIVFLLIVNGIFIVLGMICDATAIILVTVPVLLPVAVSFGIDPVHFGVITIVNLMIGLLTPPVGSVLYIMSSVTRKPIEEVFKGIGPFLVPMVAVLMLLTFFPHFSMFLPDLLGLGT